MTANPIVQIVLFGLVWMVGSFWLCGLVAVRRRSQTALHELPLLLALGSAMGLAVLGTIGVYINWWIGVSRLVHATLLGAYLVAGTIGALLWWENQEAAARKAAIRDMLVLAAVMLPALMLMAPAAATPYIYGDDDNIHVSLIRYWFQEGDLNRTSFNSMYLFPMLSSEIAAMFVPLFGLQAAKFVQLWFMLTATVGLFGVVLQVTGRPSLALVFAFLYETLPIHFIWAFAALADRASACFLTLGVGALLLKRSVGNTVAVGLSAFLLAAAAATKHEGSFALIGLGISVLCLGVITSGMRVRGRVLVGLSITCVVVLMPWYGRAYLITGNPVFPINPGANDVLLDAAQRRTWGEIKLTQRKPNLQNSLRQLYLYGRSWSDGERDRFNQQNNPLLLVLLPLVVVAGLRYRTKFPPGTAAVCVTIVVYLLLSFFLGPGLYRRMLYPIQGAIMIGCALACAAVGMRRSGIMAMWAAGVLVLLFQGIDLAAYGRWSTPFVLGWESRDQYLVRSVEGGSDVVMAIHSIGEGDRVAIDAGKMQLHVPGHIVPTTAALGEMATKKTLPSPDRCDTPEALASWLARNDVNVIVTTRDRCRGAAEWPQDSILKIISGSASGSAMLIARLR